jgi:outer membrane protein assembly factor BamB
LVDGNVRLMGSDGMLTTYYKGKKKNQTQTPLAPSGTWELVPVADGHLAIANADNRRVYELDPASGALITTFKVDTQVTFVQMTAGPANSILFVTKDNKLWQIN